MSSSPAPTLPVGTRSRSASLSSASIYAGSINGFSSNDPATPLPPVPPLHLANATHSSLIPSRYVKHATLINNCYPAKPDEKGPKSSDLSYLVFYVTSNPAKLTKVGSYIERRIIRDFRKKKLSDVHCSLEIIRSLILSEKAHINLFSKNIVIILDTLLVDMTDFDIVRHCQVVFTCFCAAHDGATLGVDLEFRTLYDRVVDRFATMATLQGDNSNRYRLVGLEALEGVVTSTALYAYDHKAQLSHVLPPILDCLINSKDGIQAVLEEPMHHIAREASRRSMSIHTDQLEKEVEDEDVTAYALQCVRSLFKCNNKGASVRLALGPTFSHLDEHGIWWPSNPTVSVIKAIVSAISPQFRYMVANELITRIDSADTSTSDVTLRLQKKATLISALEAILYSPLTLIGIPVLEVLNSLIAALTRSLVGSTSMSKEGDASRLLVLETLIQDGLVRSMGGLVMHIYYSNQVPHIISHIVAKLAYNLGTSPQPETIDGVPTVEYRKALLKCLTAVIKSSKGHGRQESSFHATETSSELLTPCLGLLLDDNAGVRTAFAQALITFLAPDDDGHEAPLGSPAPVVSSDLYFRSATHQTLHAYARLSSATPTDMAAVYGILRALFTRFQDDEFLRVVPVLFSLQDWCLQEDIAEGSSQGQEVANSVARKRALATVIVIYLQKAVNSYGMAEPGDYLESIKSSRDSDSQWYPIYYENQESLARTTSQHWDAPSEPFYPVLTHSLAREHLTTLLTTVSDRFRAGADRFALVFHPESKSDLLKARSSSKELNGSQFLSPTGIQGTHGLLGHKGERSVDSQIRVSRLLENWALPKIVPTSTPPSSDLAPPRESAEISARADSTQISRRGSIIGGDLFNAGTSTSSHKTIGVDNLKAALSVAHLAVDGSGEKGGSIAGSDSRGVSPGMQRFYMLSGGHGSTQRLKQQQYKSGGFGSSSVSVASNLQVSRPDLADLLNTIQINVPASNEKHLNAVGKAAKHEDAYTDLRLSTNATTDTCQLVKASQSWIAFKHTSGGCLAIIPLQPVGRVGQNAHQLNAHSSGVSDWEFSPFDPDLLMTGSENGEVKVWQISGDGTNAVNTELLLTIATGTGKPIETILHHPTARGIIATASQNLVQIWDITGKEQGSSLSLATHTLTHPNAVCSISWKADGALLASTCKDTQIRIFDPRQQESPIHTAQGHAGNRPSRVVWLGEKDLLFTLGFNKMREREIAVWNAQDLSKPLELKRMDSSSGLMLPLYDEDTSIMFIPSRGESTIRWIEMADSAPYMTEGAAFAVPGPVGGAGLTPKSVLNVMQTEVVRILAVNANVLWPVSVSIPRRSYLDFHSDLYPATKSTTPGLEAPEWLQGENKAVLRMSLDPGMAGKPVWAQHASNSSSSPSSSAVPSKQGPASSPSPSAPASTSVPASQSVFKAPEAITTSSQSPPAEKLAALNLSTSTPAAVSHPAAKSNTTPPSSTKSPFVASPAAQRLASQTTSKFRFLTFKPYHVSEHFDNISGLSISAIPECNLIEVNHKFVALPLQGTGGRIGILKTTEPGRVGNKIPSLVCSSEVMGFKFDPFNPNLLVTASDDTKIKGWTIPDEGLDKEMDLTKPEWVLGAPSMDKISLVLFHPRAKDVLLSASMDRSDPTLRLWDLKAQKEMIAIKGHKDSIFSCDFNHDGTKIVSVCKDKKIRVWDALTGKLVQEGAGHDSLRSARVLWLGESDLVASVGFGRGSQREILLFDSKDLAAGPVDKKLMDNSPGVLIPHYDADTSVLGISARGDRMMKHFEIHLGGRKDVGPGKSLFVDVAALEQGTLQQDVAYLPKRYCNVKEIELAKMYRLTYNSVEVIRVSVPRNKKEYFQDDLFPDTVDVETSSMEASEFFDGAAPRVPKRIALCPSDMESLSHHVAMTPVTPQGGGSSLDKFLQGKQQAADDDRKKQAMERMFETAKESKSDRDTLVPDTGIIAEDEWDD
ncbi:Coronin-7 [Dissophora globulifera]|nr:Coronin-7 [Dissophora globulifera]